MKNILLTILALFTALPLIAQEPTEVDDKIYRFAQTKAMPKEGLATFYKTFISKFKSDGLTTNETELNLRLEFVVEKDGTFTNIRLIKGDEEAGEEAIRVLKTMPAWEPATQSGKVVRLVYALPLKLSLKNNAKEEQTIRNPTVKVETDFFEFECNQCSIRETGLLTRDYRIENEDKLVEYQVSIMQMPEDMAEDIIEMFNQDIQEQNISVKDIVFLNMSMKEIGYYDGYLEHPYIQMISFYKNGYFINISAASHEPRLAVKYMNILKQSFKLNI